MREVLAEHPCNRVRWHRAPEVVALSVVAPELFELGELIVGLDAFGGHVHVESAGEGNHRLDDGHVVPLAPQPADKRSIDLEHVDREPVQITE